MTEINFLEERISFLGARVLLTFSHTISVYIGWEAGEEVARISQGQRTGTNNHSHSHSHLHLIESLQLTFNPNLHVFGLWEEAGELVENPHRHR